MTTLPSIANGEIGSSVRAKLNNSLALGWVTPQQFGAVGDGATDDTAAIQSAIDYAMSSARRIVFLPPGTYLTTDTLFLDSPSNFRAGPNVTTTVTCPALTNFGESSTFTVAMSGITAGDTLYATPSGTGVTATTMSVVASCVTDGIASFKFKLNYYGESFAGGSVTVKIRKFVVSGGFVDPPALIGVPGNNAPGYKSTIQPFNNSFIVLQVGPGQGNVIRDILISPVHFNGQYPHIHPPAGKGISVTGGSAGAHKTDITNVQVEYFYTGFSFGDHYDSLADSNTLHECKFAHCYIGAQFLTTQAYVNSLNECVGEGCVTHVFSPVGKAVNVRGGNYSWSSSYYGNFLTVPASAGAFSQFNGVVPSLSNIPCRTFRWTVRLVASGSDPNWGSGDPLVNYQASDKANVQIYNVGSIKTANFGIVPLVIENYNASTKDLTVSIDPSWMYWFAHGNTATTLIVPGGTGDCDLEAELKAATNIYLANRQTLFFGSGMNVDGCHFESPGTVTCIHNAYAGFAGMGYSDFKNCYFNDSLSKQAYIEFGSTSNAYAVPMVQAVWPSFDNVNYCRVRGFWSDDRYGDLQLAAGGWLVQGPATGRFILEDAGGGLVAPNYRVIGGLPTFTSDNTSVTTARGLGIIEASEGVNFGRNTDNGQNGNRPIGEMRSPMLGCLPAPWSVPTMPPSTLANLGPTPGLAVANTPQVFGGTTYQVRGYAAGQDRFAFVRHSGRFGTYGQDLTSTSWSYKAISLTVNVDDLRRMYVGLQIILPDDTATDRKYVVNGVVRTQNVGGIPKGYVNVTRADDVSQAVTIGSTKTTTVSGSTIKQEKFDFRKYGRQHEEVATALSELVGRKYRVGDVVWKTTTVAGASPGWLCTADGTVAIGSGAKFAPLPPLGAETFA
jgi:hypothetical protein